MERPTFALPPPVMIGFPVGALMDIPTGMWIKGTHDQYALNGGLSNINGFVGPGNSFKTTTMRYCVLSALSRMAARVPDWFYSSYDTEINTHEERNLILSHAFPPFRERNILDEMNWLITNKAVTPGNEFFHKLKTSLNGKRTSKSTPMYPTVFLDRDKVSPMKTMVPWFTDIDSLTHFFTEAEEKIMATTELGDSAANMLFARQGLNKSRMLMELPTLAAGSMNYFMFTAHLGKEMVIPSGPGTPPPRKQLQHMQQGEIIKGVTNNFFYLLHNCWLINQATPYLNQTTKAPEYPYEPGDEVAGDIDLFKVRLKQLRGKSGSSGFSLELMVSQREGVLATLSEFHYLKEHQKKFGFEGNDRNYNLVLYPEVSLSRTKVRQLCREDIRLQRAMNITSELAQMYEYQPFLKNTVLMDPKDLKEKLEAKGYDWDFLLSQTRGWHTLDDERAPGYHFSTYDLCRAARGDYHPYWLEDDCKTVKGAYAKLKEA